MISPSIYDYVKQQESSFESDEVRVGDNWNWSFRKHVQLIFHLKNGIFFSGENNWLRAFKNIMEPILNLAYWSEDIEVKDVVFYIEEEEGHVLSFLIKKYHDEVFVRENNLDTVFDQIAESDIDYGGVLVQKTSSPCPEVIKLKRIAFCDQTDILGSPIAFKHNFAPEKLRAMKKLGWGDKKNGATISIEDLIVLADEARTPAGMMGKANKVPGKSIEVYIVRGNMPEHYLKDNDDMETYCYQVQIIALYTDKDNNKVGVTLYRKEEDEGNIKFHTSHEVEDRALGRGVGESLLHPQVWTNFLTIHKTNMLESASKIPLYTDDSTYTQRNKIQDMENLEITTIEDGKQIRQVPTAAPLNIQLMEKAINEWHEEAQYVGSAFDPQMGKEAVSGTTFRGQNQIVQQGRGMHERRRGQRAKFIEEMYRDWLLPDMKKAILKGKKFLATLTLDEMEWVAQRLVENQTNKFKKYYILDNAGEAPTPEMTQAFGQQAMDRFKRKGNKHLLEILKNEMDGIEIRMGIDIAGKQKDLVGMVDNLTSVFKTILANPYILKSPPIQKLFNKIIEASGLEPVDLSGFDVPPMPMRRMTETVNYADLAVPPNDTQKQFLELAGIQPDQQFAPPPQPVVAK